MPSALFAQNSESSPGVGVGTFGSGVVVGGGGVVDGMIVLPGSPQTETNIHVSGICFFFSNAPIICLNHNSA